MMRTAPKKDAKQKSFERRPPRLLLVHGPGRAATRFSFLAQKAGFSVHFARDLDRALDIQQEIWPDVVVLTTGHGIEKSKQFCQVIRARDGERHTGIFFLSGAEDSKSEAATFLEMGGDEFMALDGRCDEFSARLLILLRDKERADRLRTANFHLRQLAVKDELTGLYNMRGFKYGLRWLVEKKNNTAALKDLRYAVIMFDLDHFKKINDSTDHLTGSYCLTRVAQLLREAVRGTGAIPARYGGDEFIVAVLVEDQEALSSLAESIQRLICAHEFSNGVFSLRITTSIGAALADGDEAVDFETLIQRADQMLYEGKRTGRNKISCWPPSRPAAGANLSGS